MSAGVYVIGSVGPEKTLKMFISLKEQRAAKKVGDKVIIIDDSESKEWVEAPPQPLVIFDPSAEPVSAAVAVASIGGGSK
jgi:hypothetical protein